MLLSSFLLGSLLFSSGEGIVINEFSYDDSSTDDREFVELYNPTSSDVDISGWVLEATDQATPDNNTDYTIPANTTLKAGAFYVLGSALVPNVNQIVGTTNLWENSQESLTLTDKGGNVVDTVVYEANKGWPTAKNTKYREGEGVWGNMTSIDNIETSWSRVRDGHDTDNNGLDFALRPSTPGKSNNLKSGPYVDNFDGLTVGNDLADFGGSFVKPRVIDPTKADSNNPNAITASPQGGKAAICWDPAGGGDMAMLLRDASCDVTIEAYVYFDAKLEPTGEREVWTFGKGTTGTFYNLPDPSGAASYTANGNTGVAWTFEVTDKAATLYLVDHNDGGTGANAKTSPTVLGKINVTTSGWNRLRLEVSGSTATGYFGGTYGGTNGQKISGTISAPADSGIYIGYREALSTNSTARPFTFDNLMIVPGAASGSIINFGTVEATTVATPRVGTNGCPLVGSSSFQVTGGGLVPGGSPSLLLVGTRLRTPVDMQAAIGGPAGSFLYVLPVLVFSTVSDANGDVFAPLGIPNDASLKGKSVSFQIFDFDKNMTVPFQFGNSDGLALVIG